MHIPARRSRPRLRGWIGVFLLLTIWSAPGGADAGSKPNFLVVVADDMGFSDAGCYGGEIATPNLDALARNGLRYTQMYSTARCWPSRTCILTGYYAQQVRMDPPQGRLPAWTRVLPHYLKPAGYRCYHSGKWHLLGAPGPLKDGGFDRSYTVDDQDRFFSPKASRLDDEKLPAVSAGTDFYATKAQADSAVRFLQEHAEQYRDRPFFLYLAFTAPHFPLHALPEDIARYRAAYLEGWDSVREKRYGKLQEMGIVEGALSRPEPAVVPHWNLSEAELQKRIGPGEAGRAVPWEDLTAEQKGFQAGKMAIHAAMIDRLDRELGRVLDQVRSMKALDNTVVFFVSDNGASAEQIIRGDGHDPTAPPGSAKSYLCLGPGWSTASNTPFRFHKSWVHEGGSASPLIVCWPAGIRDRGELRCTPAHFIDLVPTLLELAGVSAAGDWNGTTPPGLPGRSLVGTFRKDVTVPRDFLYWHHMTHRALRVGNWKIVSCGGKQQEGPWELYDLGSDRSETRDLAAEQPERVDAMAKLWQQCEDLYREQAGSP